MLLGDPFGEVLALKLGKLASEQPGIALNIPPMAQNFGGPEVNHRRHLTEMAHNCPFGWGVPSSPLVQIAWPNQGSGRQRGQSGIVLSTPTKKTPLRAGLEVDGE